jgi:hypothetical protein
MTDEQLQRAADLFHKREGRYLYTVEGMREQTELYLDQLAQLPEISRQRLMYGQWLLADECEECHTIENVTKFADIHRRVKGPVYLCAKCYLLPGNGPEHLRKWRPGDDTR